MEKWFISEERAIGLWLCDGLVDVSTCFLSVSVVPEFIEGCSQGKRKGSQLRRSRRELQKKPSQRVF